jgi:uncharacterized protein (TIGR02996 family)
MSDEAALRKAIVAAPDEDAPRLVYADWLDENRPDPRPTPARGPSARAEFIRVQCRLAAGAFHDPDYPELLEREQDLAAWLATHEPDELARPPALTDVEHLELGEWGDWRRGFVESLGFDEYHDTAEATLAALIPALQTAFAHSPARTLRLEDATAEEVALLVRHPLFGQLRGLQLDYCTDGEGTEAVVALAQSRWTSRLRRLFLDFPIKRVELASLARSRYLSALESLTIDYPALGAAEIRALGRAKWLRNLRRLQVWIENGLALEALADLPVMPRLECLTLQVASPSSFGPAAKVRRFVASRSFPNLAYLNLAGCHLPPDKLALLAEGRWPLRHLVLTGNEVRRQGCEAIVAAPFAATLRVLELRDCEIAASGVQVLAAAESLAGLRHLDLSENPIGAGGLLAIAASPTLSGLRALGLRRINTPRGPVTAHAVTRFLTTLTMPHLRHLQLSGLPVGVRGARVLADRPTFGQLTRLGLERCCLGAAAVEALAQSRVLTNLVVLDLSWNRAGAAARLLTRRRVFPRLAACSLEFNRLSRAVRLQLGRRPGLRL